MKFRKLHFPILLLLIFPLLSGCLKDENPQFDNYTCESNCYIIEGYMFKKQDNGPYANVELSFSKYYNQFKVDLLGTRTTDANGYYKFTMPVSYFENTSHSIRLEITKDDIVYSPRVFFIDFDSTDVDNSKRVNIGLFKASQVVVKLHNGSNVDYGSISVDTDAHVDSVPAIGQTTHFTLNPSPEIKINIPAGMPVDVSWKTYSGVRELEGYMRVNVPAGEVKVIDVYM